LLDLNNRRIKSGSIISSDSWKAYIDLTHLISEYKFEEHKSANY